MLLVKQSPSRCCCRGRDEGLNGGFVFADSSGEDTRTEEVRQNGGEQWIYDGGR